MLVAVKRCSETAALLHPAYYTLGKQEGSREPVTVT